MMSIGLMHPKDTDEMADSVGPGPEVIKLFHAQLEHENFPAHKC